MKTLDQKSIFRKLLIYDRKKQIQVKISPEGVYFKRERTRWSSAIFMPWMAGFTVAAHRWAEEQKRLKKERRLQKKLVIL